MSSAKRALARRRDKGLAAILSAKESALDEFVPSDLSFAFRKVVLNEINDIVDLAFDLMDTIEGDQIVNELFIKRLEEIHSDVRSIADDLFEEYDG